MAKTYVQVVIGAASIREGRDGVMGEAGDDSSSLRLSDSFGDILQGQEPNEIHEIRFLQALAITSDNSKHKLHLGSCSSRMEQEHLEQDMLCSGIEL